jgi:hypothetical protein
LPTQGSTGWPKPFALAQARDDSVAAPCCTCAAALPHPPEREALPAKNESPSLKEANAKQHVEAEAVPCSSYAFRNREPPNTAFGSVQQKQSSPSVSARLCRFGNLFGTSMPSVSKTSTGRRRKDVCGTGAVRSSQIEVKQWMHGINNQGEGKLTEAWHLNGP